MSRVGKAGFGVVLAAMMATACADPGVSPVEAQLVSTRVAQSAVSLDITPSSVGWHEQARSLVGQNNLSPLAAARVYAALSVAQYAAVMQVGDADANGVLPENGIGAGGRSAVEAHRGAVAGASVTVLSRFFPAAAANLAQRAATLGGTGKVHPQFARGLAIGNAAGDAMIQRLANDRFTAPWTGTVPTGPGMWIANGPPAGATFGNVMTYFLTSGDQFRPGGPPAFTSPAFAADRDEIRALSDGRTPQQTSSAIQWNYATGTFTPPGYWDLVTANYITTYRLDERAATHAFALTNGSGMDALIACWDAKYFYWTLRPSQADAGITLTFGLPNHPSYPSGHSCVSSAAATVLTHLFPERATELAGWVTESGLSRMYAGIHYRFDITAGQDLGQAVANWAIALDENVGLLAAIAR